jgi:hypothetical protein
MTTNSNIHRVKQLIATRKSGDIDQIQLVENAIALAIVGPDLALRDKDVRSTAHPQHGDLTGFAATETFARIFHRAIADFATQRGIRAPTYGKYDLLFITPMMFKDLWVTRQLVDELGIPYDYYLRYAIAYWVATGHNRIPRPTQLRTSDVIAHVVEQWVSQDDSSIAPAVNTGLQVTPALQV